MPDATITSTASTFGTISGVFSADQSTISGTISGIVPGTLTGSVGVPGPAGLGVPAGGTSGQFLQKTSGVDYATDWVTVNLTGLATESWVTAGFYPLTGNPSGFLTASALSPYLTSATAASTYQTLAGMSSYLTTSAAAAGYYPLSGNPSGFLTAASLSGYATESWVTGQGYITSAALTPYLTSATAASTYQTISGMSAYLTKADNLGSLTNFATARTNLGLGSLAVVNDAPSDGSQYARKNGAWDVVTTTPDYISSVSSPLSVTSGNLTIDLSAYAPLASPAFTGNPTAPTATFGDNDTSLATTAFVQSALAGGTAVARNLEVEVRNQSGSTIAAGSIVYISGATGNKPLITLAQANNDANSAQTIGFVKTAIANNGTGYVIVRGELENIDTSALTEGVQLYLSPTVAGSWTTTKPSAPQHLVYVGIVIRSHPTLGTILVAVQNGYELDELHDVAIASKANNDLLAYESSTDLWKNKTYSALGLLTSADAASTYYLQTNPDGYITNSALSGYATESFVTSQGYLTQYNCDFLYLKQSYNLSDLTDFSAARTNLGLGTMATATASDYSTTTVANGLYYPLTGNPSSFLVAADIAGKADLASPALTGNVTITSNSTSPALVITQDGTGDVVQFKDVTSDTSYSFINANGKVGTIASTTTNAGFNVPHGTAPTTPVNGDIWTTTSGFLWRQNGTTQQAVDIGGTQTISGTKTFSAASLTFGNATSAGTISIASGALASGTKTLNLGTGGAAGSTTNINIGTSGGGTSTATVSALLVTRASATTGAGLRILPGTAPTSPVNGDVWTDTAGIYARINGATVTMSAPSAATVAEAKAGNDTTKFINSNVLQKIVNSPSYYKFPRGLLTGATSGTGATVASGALITNITGTSANAGWAQYKYYGLSGIDIVNGTGWMVGANNGFNFAKQIRVTGSTNLNGAMSTNTIVRVVVGKQANDGGGDPTTPSIGWRYNQATGFIEIIAHNGTSLVTLTTASNPAASSWFEWELHNNGSGSVQMFVNDVSIGTLTGGPTGQTFSSAPTYVEEIQTTATPSAQRTVSFRNGGIFLQP